ncbi:hypothetical protein [Chryseobacterium sp.]|uniref:hypothetical protein n=1 Tax=Chryseobacterium sp. TaxID=1871047 RepID=UPI00289884F5|nr:hypothetical protein [Chryseobacterium sp.]
MKLDGNQVLYQILKEKNVDLLQFIIESCFFSTQESVTRDKNEMLQNIDNEIPLFIRHKSKINEIIKKSDKKSISKKQLALKYQENNELFYKIQDKKIRIKFDSDGNYEIKKKIKRNTSFGISSGKKTSDLINFKISHIWDKTSHPMYFSSLWNIIIVPQCLDHFIDDKNININHDCFPGKILNTKMFFKALVTVLYDLEIHKVQNSTYFESEEIPQDYKLFAKSYIDKIKYFNEIQQIII